MAQVVPTTTPTLPLREQIRMFLRDVPGHVPGAGANVENILLEGVEFSDAELVFATELAVSKYNRSNPPIRPLLQGQIPIDLLMLGIAYFLIGSESFRQLRNQASAQDSEVNLGIDDKHQQYLQLKKFLGDEFETGVTQHKIARNMRQGWGGINSAYAWSWVRGRIV